MDLIIKNNDKEIIFSFGENWKKLDKEILWQYFERALKRLNLNKIIRGPKSKYLTLQKVDGNKRGSKHQPKGK